MLYIKIGDSIKKVQPEEEDAGSKKQTLQDNPEIGQSPEAKNPLMLRAPSKTGGSHKIILVVAVALVSIGLLLIFYYTFMTKPRWQ